MRHATAEPHTEMEDVPLVPLGKAEARLMGRWLRSTGYTIDLVIHSPLKRGVQTAKRMANRIDAKRVEVPELEPHGNPETAWKAILKAANGADHLLVITHGPLIQNLRDWLIGAVAGTSRFDQHWAYGCIHHIKDGREHWVVAPHVIARTRDEQKKLNESDSEVAEHLDRMFSCLAESLRRKNKAQIVDPIISKLTAATKARFRKQGSVVAKAIKERIQEADTAAARQAAGAALAGFTYAAWLAAHRKATAAAYRGGSATAASQLDAAEPDGLDGPDRTAELAETQIDGTTRDRVLGAILDGLGQAAILAAVAGVFRSRQGDAETIATHEVSDAFHDGMVDAAAAISDDIGEDVEKHWDADEDACDDCQDCDDEGWVDLDFTYPAFGVDEPDGHPNCRCSLEVRRAGKE